MELFTYGQVPYPGKSVCDFKKAEGTLIPLAVKRGNFGYTTVLQLCSYDKGVRFLCMILKIDVIKYASVHVASHLHK
jgi:hypothetical protein